MKGKKRIKWILFGLLLVLLLFIIGYFIQDYRIRHAKIEVTLVDDLTLNFLEKKKISDYIISINGTILNDEEIDSSSIGKKQIHVLFKNEDKIKVSYDFEIEVVDRVAPIVWLSGSYTIMKNQDIDLTSKILCGDNEDDHPNCSIVGEYDTKVAGVYPLVFKAVDRSGNETNEKFNLYVKEPNKKTQTKPTTPSTPSYVPFHEVQEKYKTENTKIGIDVSSWQGDIDFEALKNAGVEFMMIRVGGTRGRDKEYFVDDYFVNNITKANEYGIDVGIYYYSYASSIEKAKEEALWVIDQIKGYKVTLPIAYDWENWSSYNDYHLSFFGLTSMAETFLDTIHSAGYEGLLYSSKNYLEKLWMPSKYETWLAHYVNKTNYQGSYRMWQHCSDGRVDGIKGDVDIDILYLNQE